MAITTVLQHLEAAYITAQGCENDRIGLRDTLGLEVWTDSMTGVPTIVKIPFSETDAIESWMAGLETTPPDQTSKLTSQLLIGDQIIQEDQLRPPADAGPTNFSRSQLATNFGFPHAAIDRISRFEPCYLEYPSSKASSAPPCKVMVVGGCSLVQNEGQCHEVSYSMLVFRRYGNLRNQLLTDLDSLAVLGLDTGCIAYLICKLIAECNSLMLEKQRKRSLVRQLHITRYGGSEGLDTLLHGAHMALQGLDRDLADLQNSQAFAESNMVIQSHGPPEVSNHHWSRLQSQRQDIRSGLHLLQQVFQTNIRLTRNLHEQTSQQMQTCSNLLALPQHSASLRPAE